MQVLLLNNTYEALNILTIQRAMKLVSKGIVSIEEISDRKIHSAMNEYEVPSVIRMLRYISIPHRAVNLKRKNIFLRDKFVCQYCGKIHNPNDLTIDHLIPRSKGGSNSWENVVTACRKCNQKKGHKSLRDCGMTLIKKPEMPKQIVYLHIVKHLGRDNECWKKYLFE